MEEKKDFFETNNSFDEKVTEENKTNENDINIYESRCSVGDREWFSDDFEKTAKNSVLENKAISIYKPKEKKKVNFFKSSFFAAARSSVITCVLCLSVFAFVLKPTMQQKVNLEFRKFMIKHRLPL